MSFKVIAQMMDAASNFETRLVLLGKSLVQDREVKHLADNQDGAAASDMEVLNIGTLRTRSARCGDIFWRRRTWPPSGT